MPEDINNLEFESKNKRLGGAVNNVLSRQIPYQAKLKDMLDSWPEIVGPGVAKHSSPYDLVNGTLYVCADSSAARYKIVTLGDRLRKIIKAKWDLNVKNIRVTAGLIPSMPVHQRRKTLPVINPTPDEIKYFSDQMPENLKLNNQKAAEALARLQAVFAKKFKK